MNVALKGMTWSHPRGYDPLVACSRLWKESTGVEIIWDKRSLQDFESFPVEELARAYDLIVIDHPHVGQITAEGCLLPLDVEGREGECAALERASVGPSWRSYTWQGRQWALPIDAAAQVQAFRPDRLERAPESLAEVFALARLGRVALPLRSPHALMTFMTIAANLGRACAAEEQIFLDRSTGREVWSILGELAGLVDHGDFDRDPIAVFERMAAEDRSIDCVPFIYGYVSYAKEHFRPRRIAFTDIPVAGTEGPVGATLGGTGIAVSAHTRHAGPALNFAYWVAGDEVQCEPYASAGGQPGNGEAWENAAVNAPVAGFYKATRATLQGSYLRPRHDGYMAFQAAASERLSQGLKTREAADPVLDDLNRLFAESF